MWEAILDGQPIIISNIQSLMTKAELTKAARAHVRMLRKESIPNALR